MQIAGQVAFVVQAAYQANVSLKFKSHSRQDNAKVESAQRMMQRVLELLRRYHSLCFAIASLPVLCGRNVQPSHGSPRTDHRMKRPEEHSSKVKKEKVGNLNQ